MNPTPPVPVCKAFLVCRKTGHDPKTKEPVLIGFPKSFTYRVFPAAPTMGFFARLTSGHGEYQIEVQLQSAIGDVVWRDGPPRAIPMDNPLALYDVTMKMGVALPGPGHFDFVLTANGEEVARQPFLVQLPAEQVKY